MTNIDTKLMQTYKTAGERRDMIVEAGNDQFDSVGITVFSFESKLVCDVWNAAIESAAKIAEYNDVGPSSIRKLKK